MADEALQIPLREYLDQRFEHVNDDLRQLKQDVKALETSRDQLAGKADAAQVNRALVLAGLSLTLAAVGVLLRFLGV